MRTRRDMPAGWSAIYFKRLIEAFETDHQKNIGSKRQRNQTDGQSDDRVNHFMFVTVRFVSFHAGARLSWLNMDYTIRTVGLWLLLDGMQSMAGWTANLCAPRSRQWESSGFPCGRTHSDDPGRISFPGCIRNKHSCACLRLNVFHRCRTVPLLTSPADL